MSKLLVGQSGGPTAAINATVAGVIEAALSAGVEPVGAQNGILGLLNEKFISLAEFSDPQKRRALSLTPAAALGSARYKLKHWEEDESDYIKAFDVLKKHGFTAFVLIGGNDSMDTVAKLSGYAEAKGITDIKIVGAPKTIDNDLAGMDHTPGYGSAAKYVATTLTEVRMDCDVYDKPSVTLVEIMGRDAGWLTAAASLACDLPGGGPDLIYLPEVAFDENHFVADIRRIQETQPVVLVALSEGIRDANGCYVGAACQSGAVDTFGHKYLAGAARYLESVVKDKIGCKVRSAELNVMQRCAGHLLSKTDIEESAKLGALAAETALNGAGGIISCIERVSDDPYAVTYTTKAVKDIANKVRHVPREMINDAGNGVTSAFKTYAAPLVEGEIWPEYKNGFPVYCKLYNR